MDFSQFAFVSNQFRWLMSRSPEQLIFRREMRYRLLDQRRVRRFKRKLLLLVRPE